MTHKWSTTSALPEKSIPDRSDHGGGKEIPDPKTPDLDAKLAGLQSPRGWGLFLIQNMVDEVHTTVDEAHQTIELIMYLKESDDDSETP